MTVEPPDDSSTALVTPPPRHHDRVGMVLRGAGQTLITAGLVVLLFVVYEVWVTNIFAHYKQQKVENDLVQEFAQGKDPLAQATLPGGGQQTIPVGTGIANLYIPRLGDDYHFAIVQGTDDASLDKGPGHYVGTALPGQKGDFAVAGHRVGKGEPFLNLDKLQPGDAVVVETATSWYVYRVFGDTASNNLSVSAATAPADATVTEPPPAQALASKVIGREVVDPSDGKVILPVPNDLNVNQSQATGALMTLTTCTPKFSATQRMIVHAYLARTVPRAPTTSGQAEQLPKELSGGTL
jgi:sortase A